MKATTINRFLVFICAALAGLALTLGYFLIKCQEQRSIQSRWLRDYREVYNPERAPAFLSVRAEGGKIEQQNGEIVDSDSVKVEPFNHDFQYIELGTISRTSLTINIHAHVTDKNAQPVQRGLVYACLYSQDAALNRMPYPSEGIIYQYLISNGYALIRYPLPNDIALGEHKIRVGYKGGTNYADAMTTVFLYNPKKD